MTEEEPGAAHWLVAHLHQLALVGALLFLAGVVGYAVGSRSDRPPRADSVEVDFLRGMIAHHEQALQLSNEELANGENVTAKSFAREILLFQSYEIGLMERQLAHWGYGPATDAVDAMPGMADEAELAALAEATGPQADALFIALMRDHHAGGVHMATVAARRAKDPFVRDLAERMAANQRVEINELAAARDRAGLAADPPGFRPDPIPSADSREDHGDHR